MGEQLCMCNSKAGIPAKRIVYNGQNQFFYKRDLGQTNEQQRHFNRYPISELHGEVDSIQTSLKLLFTLKQ